MYFYKKFIKFQVPIGLDLDDAVKIQQEDQRKINGSKELTENELLQKISLLENGFKKWSLIDFNNFVKAMEKYGRHDIENISNEVDGKTCEEVKEYFQIFWKRCYELKDIQKIMAQIQKGDVEVYRRNSIEKALEKKVSSQ